ncbi:MAG: hypothetical protein IPP69_05535 [Flavobacteriales bacterium]|nr:hypothetical protein [Flavobacteriales bacterium]
MKISNYTNTFLCLALILIIQSCSIQKRRYSGGFHIEWHNEKKIQNEIETPNVKTEARLKFVDVRLTEEDSISSQVKKHSSLMEKSDKLEQNTPAKQKRKKVLSDANKLGHDTKSTTQDKNSSYSTPQVTVTPKRHEGAQSSLKMILWSYLLIFIYIIILILSVAFLLDGMLIAILFVFGGIVVLILSFLLAIIASAKAMFALWEMKRTPEIYLNKWQAVLTIVLGLLFLWLLYIIPLIVFMFKVQIAKNKERLEAPSKQPSFDSHD